MRAGPTGWFAFFCILNKGGNMLQFNAPSNFKKGRLIASRFRVIDLIIAIFGITVSVILINTFMPLLHNMFWLIFMMMPAAIGIILVCPAGQYHNILVFLQVVLIFYTSQRRYIWEGVHKESYEEDKNEENVEG